MPSKGCAKKCKHRINVEKDEELMRERNKEKTQGSKFHPRTGHEGQEREEV
jgi:hypothetical protein